MTKQLAQEGLALLVILVLVAFVPIAFGNEPVSPWFLAIFCGGWIVVRLVSIRLWGGLDRHTSSTRRNSRTPDRRRRGPFASVGEALPCVTPDRPVADQRASVQRHQSQQSSAS